MSVSRTLLASCILLVVGGAVLTAATDHLQAFTSETARSIDIREHRPQVPAVTLETQAGERINLADLRGKWVVVDFIYTRCMTYCELLGADFVRLRQQLAKPVADGRVQLLSISFDPEHDSPRELADYLNRFGSHGKGWLAARPVNAAGLEDLVRIFGVTVIPDGLGGFVHNASIEIVNPQGRVIDVFEVGNSAIVGQTVLRYAK